MPIAWGYPTDLTMRKADEGLVVIGGCVVDTRVMPSHECADCQAEFIASSLLYRRVVDEHDVFGIGVWPTGDDGSE